MQRNKNVGENKAPFERKRFNKQLENPDQDGCKQDSPDKRMRQSAMIDEIKFWAKQSDKVVDVRQPGSDYTKNKKMSIATERFANNLAA